MLLCQVAADVISRWLYPQLDPQLRLLDLSSEAQQHKDFLAGWIELLSTTPNMMPFDKVRHNAMLCRFSTATDMAHTPATVLLAWVKIMLTSGHWCRINALAVPKCGPLHHRC
jgi:hypothetical protein